MNILKRSFLIIIIALITNSIAAQEPSDSSGVAATLEELFTVCNSVIEDNNDNSNFERLDHYIVYMGNDETKRWKTACDYNDAEDRIMVEKIGKSIKKILDSYESYKIQKYYKVNQSEGEWHALKLKFSKDKENKEITFAFLKIGDAYLLGDQE